MIFVSFPAWIAVPVFVLAVIGIIYQASKEKRMAKKMTERKAEQKRLVHEFVDSRPVEDFRLQICHDTAQIIGDRLGISKYEAFELIQRDLSSRGIDLFSIKEKS